MSVGARFSFISEKIGKETDLFLLFSFSPPPLLVELHADENYSVIILIRRRGGSVVVSIYGKGKARKSG